MDMWFWFIYLLVFGVIGAWVVSDARDRGNSKGDQIGIFFGVLFLGIIGLIAWFLIRPKKKHGMKTAEDMTPLQILQMRYAKGHITKKEYDEMKKEIK
jgi:uncharacterized membrane protein